MIVYIDDARNPSMKSETLIKRGHCCKSACIHCPYGFTLKRFGLKFLSIDETNKSLYNDLEKQIDMKLDLESYSANDYKLLTLKNFVIGLIRVDHLFVREFEILPSFKNQGISKELIESYYFY